MRITLGGLKNPQAQDTVKPINEESLGVVFKHQQLLSLPRGFQLFPKCKYLSLKWFSLISGCISFRIHRGYNSGVSTGYFPLMRWGWKTWKSAHSTGKWQKPLCPWISLGTSHSTPPAPQSMGTVSLHFHVNFPSGFTWVCGVGRLSEGELGQAKTFSFNVTFGCTWWVMLFQMGRWEDGNGGEYPRM